jgi:hypothetical protein
MRFFFTLLASLPLTTALAGELRLNSATAEEFAAVEGVDAQLAAEIVALRSSRGGHLPSVEALRVLSLPPAALDSIREEAIIDLQVSTSRQSYSSVDEVLAEFSTEPDVRQAQAMAMAYTNTNPELVEGWLRASRSAYMLPKLNLQYEKELDTFSDFEYIATDSSEPEPQLDESRSENDDKYVVKLEWRLDKLVMSSEQIRVINESQDIVKLRDKVLDEVTRLYFDRRRLQVDLLLSPPSDLRAQLENELRLQELTANLDALTGGAFTASL